MNRGRSFNVLLLCWVMVMLVGNLLTPWIARAAPAPQTKTLFQDDFTANTNGWIVGESSDSYGDHEARIVGGKYEMALKFKQDALNRSWVPQLSAQDFQLTVDVQVVNAGANTTAFVSFREDVTGNYYAVYFAANGLYSVGLLHQGAWHKLQDWTQSRAIRLQPGVVNTFGVLAQGDLFTIYANNKELTTVKDDTLAQGGKIGFGVAGATGESAVVQFDNLAITTEQADQPAPQAVLVSSTGESASSDFQDEFNKTQLDPHWHWYYEDRDRWMIEPLSGYLRLIGRRGDMAAACNNPNNLLLQPAPAGDFEILTRLSLEPTSNYQQGGVAVFGATSQGPDLDNYVKLDLLWNGDLGGKSVEFLWEADGRFAEQQWPYLHVTQSQAAWLKLVRTGNVFTGYYSADGKAWAQVGAHTVEGLSSSLVGVYALAGATSESCQPAVPAITVDFDYVRIRANGTVHPQGNSTPVSNQPTAVVQAAALNVRNGPGTQYSRIAGVTRGATLTITGQANRCAWLQVQTTTGVSGWIAGGPQYVTLQGDCAVIPVATASTLPEPTQLPAVVAQATPQPAVAVQPANQGCFNFQNQLGAELTFTFTSKDRTWNKSFSLARAAEQVQCFEVGRYTYTIDAPPPWGSSNGELTVNSGDRFNFPVRSR